MSAIQMTRLGKMGRFANQLFQYMFLRIYAHRYGATVEVPSWVGKDLFGLHDPKPSVALPRYVEHTDKQEQAHPPEGSVALGHDFEGYGQYHTSWYAPYRTMIRQLFEPVEPVVERLQPAVEMYHNAGETRVGLHLRRGDYGRTIFYLTPIEWYVRLLRHLWPVLDDPVLFVASEDRSLVEAFAEFYPLTAEELGVDLRQDPMPHYNYERHDLIQRDPWQLDFYPDFYLLQQSNVLIGPNSTFSFAAAMLAPELWAYYRSVLPTQDWECIDPWDAYPLQHDKVEDYPDVEGIRSDPSNQYWR